MNASSLLSGERLAAAHQLLTEAGCPRPWAWSLLNGGANNQVFRVHLPQGSVLLKAYFWHPDDPRDRLGADFGFARLAWTNGVRALAQPLACDPSKHLALFEYLFGAKLRPREVTWPVARAALDFFLAVNALREKEEARQLPAGSEACFRLHDHLHCLRRRVERLRTLPVQSPVEAEAADFVTNQLEPRCAGVLAEVVDQAARLGISLEQTIPKRDRCLSPSDFGFHNALRLGDGAIKFIDFEYAGWDDPAKLVADFFCQPQCPVPLEFFEPFALAVARETSDPDWHLHRCRLLLPVYRLKWCCIMLNDFLPGGNQRRRFARGGVAEGQKQQLLKARAALRDVFPLGPWRRAA